METADWIRWGIIALMAVAQLFEIVRSERAHKKEIAAKDAALAAKDAQIETLRELTSAKVREHYLAMKAQLEEFIEDLKQQVDQKENEIKALEDDHVSKAELIQGFDMLFKHFQKQYSESHKRLEEGLKQRQQELSESKDLTILFAQYGANQSWIDVAPILRAKIKEGKLQAMVSNEEFGGWSIDPARGVLKTLQITYLYRGNTISKAVAEKHTLVIPEP